MQPPHLLRVARSARFLTLFAGIAALATGCQWFEARIDPQLERRLARQLQTVRPLDLTEFSEQPPRTVDEALPTALDRRTASQPATSERLPLEIAQIRGRALENNLDLQVQMLEPAIARTVVSEEQAKFDQLIYVNVKRQRQDLPPIDDELVPLTRDAQQNQFFVYEPGVIVPLPSGGVFEASMPFSKKKLDFEEKTGQYLAGLKFSLSQPLLRDAGFDVNLASIRLARYSRAEVDTRTVLEAIRVLAAAEKAYWRLYGAWQRLEIRREQYNLAYDNFDLVSRQVEEGARPEIERIRAQVGVTDQLEDLIRAETNLRLAQRDLRRIVEPDTVGVDDDVLIVAESEPQLVAYELDRAALADQALANRLELLTLELQLAADALRIDLARNEALPLFVLDYSYEALGRSNSFSDAFNRLGDFDRAGWTLSLRGELPVSNEVRLSQLRRSLLTRTQRLATREQRMLAIRQEVFDTLDLLNQNWQRILAARQNVLVAGEVFELEKIQFEAGLRTQIEVLEALNRLGNARTREVLAIVDYQLTQIDLAFATGTLLGYARVDLAPLPLGDAMLDTPVPDL